MPYMIPGPLQPDPLTVRCPGCERPVGVVCYEIEQMGSPDGASTWDVPYDLTAATSHYSRINAAALAAAKRC
jgi:hypothetical protein